MVSTKPNSHRLAIVTSPLASAPAVRHLASVRILLNDQPAETTATDVRALMRERGLAEEPGVAVAVDGQVIPRGCWSETALAEGAQILVIRAAQGG